ncbi:MAG TPA: glycoside hydrolase [Firmicutes bacterium]|jgi:cell wall-associated NlpC family hydrolase|nr:glycoside hydrolase [Bacillota bacterium]
MEQEQMNAVIKKYLGIPYKHAGRDLTGLDCLGLAHYFYKDCGIEFPENDGRDYSIKWAQDDPERYLRGVSAIGKPVPVEELKTLDFVYFRLGRFISHGAVMVDSNHFIHVLQHTVVHINVLDPVWKKRLVGARRLIDLP